MTRKKYQYVPVHPDFYKRLKIEAAKTGTSVMKLTERLAQESQNDEKELRRFNMRF